MGSTINTLQFIPRGRVPLPGNGLDLSEETTAEIQETDEDTVDDDFDDIWEVYEEDEL